jgi:rhodanese-related sulfurtransferase
MRDKGSLNSDNDQNHILHYQRKLQYEIDAWDLQQALEKGENIVVIDARSTEAYQNEHIPGAISFPHRTMDKNSTQARLDSTIQYVTYCDGIGCNASTKGALKLAQLGYQVKELIGGIDWWKRDGYSTETNEFCSLQSNNPCGCD